ncbi:MAG: LysR family transcriptional regulator [Proteobacteria bacterium]|jgi:LysR family transcriptional regulator for metE and metH|nr:LysR family transcriptional regulator [Pseudomonadota bacterium]
MKAIHAKVATRNLDRIHLQIVREVDRQGSMTAAATTLHLTQSALSHAVRKLEAALGASLWLREGRRLRPTEAGQYLLDVANHVLPQLEHAESSLRQMARGTRGTLRIGMECHPCYQWLLKVVAQYLPQWPDVDVDVKQRFRFGGISALLDHEIDLLVTPDPEPRPGLLFEPVFDYEQVLVVPRAHPLAKLRHVEPAQLADEVLITYPVDTDRLDIYTLFLNPAGVTPRAHRTLESTDLILEMVACGRGVGALPRWLVEERMKSVAIAPVRLGRAGVPKKIHLGLREGDLDRAWFKAFMQVARRRR